MFAFAITLLVNVSNRNVYGHDIYQTHLAVQWGDLGEKLVPEVSNFCPF